MTDERPIEQQPRHPSILRSKVLWLALLATLVGLGLWIRDVVTQPPPAAPIAASGGAANSLTAGGSPTAAPATTSTPAAPTIFRLGASFSGGFFLAWVMRKFIKTTLLVAGGIAVAIAALKGTGVIDLDWSAVEKTVDSSLDEAQQQAGAAKDWVMRYLPSGTSAVVGMFFGARR